MCPVQGSRVWKASAAGFSARGDRSRITVLWPGAGLQKADHGGVAAVGQGVVGHGPCCPAIALTSAKSMMIMPLTGGAPSGAMTSPDKERFPARSDGHRWRHGLAWSGMR